jgi:HAMP domain-containing protein
MTSSALLGTLAAAALAVAATTGTATAGRTAPPQDKLSIGVEAEQLGRNRVKITIAGKKFTPEGPVFITTTSLPGTATELDLGRILADKDGKIAFKKDDLECSTPVQEDAARPVFVTITDSTTNRKARQRVEGTAWLCR